MTRARVGLYIGERGDGNFRLFDFGSLCCVGWVRDLVPCGAGQRSCLTKGDFSTFFLTILPSHNILITDYYEFF